MRSAVLAATLFLSACGRSEEAPTEQPTSAARAPGPELAIFAGEGRNRLCIDESASRAAFITYGESDTNCTVQGAVQRTGGRSVIVPDGDSTCRIDLANSGDVARLGQQTSSCTYYCGPRSSFAGAEFRRSTATEPVTDFAGDPLC